MPERTLASPSVLLIDVNADCILLLVEQRNDVFHFR
jgi:hypothetical protein